MILAVAWPRRAAALAIGALMCLAGGGVAAPDRGAHSRAELDAVQSRLREAREEAADTQKTRDEAAAALAAAEKAVSRIRRALRETAAERRRVEGELEALRGQLAATARRIEEGQRALGHWLRRYYQHGGEPGVGHLLSAREPNQLARDAYYLERIGREKQAIVNRLREARAEHERQLAEVQAREARVAALEARRRSEAAALEKEQARRSRIVAELSAQLAERRKEVAALERDAGRLAALIRRLEQEPPPPRRATPQPADEPTVGEASEVAGREGRGKVFAQLRGRMRAPVRGTVVGRFGADRVAGGTSWKGIFIRSARGGEVHAVADGRVVFSDWLRGFGNLLIIDHGNDYLTVYGNNEALFKSIGDWVVVGDVVAEVGDSGGNPESGLYFEVRHQGRPLDPLDWIRLN